MRAWMLPAGSDGFDKLYQEERPDPAPGPGEVLIQVHACSINYRDFAVAAGKYFGGELKAPAVPLSDGAGQVVAVGAGVTRFKEGDRVQSSFFTKWEDGPPRASPALGDGLAPGMLAELVTLPEAGVVPMAESLDYAQAACLPCAGVTAWNALYEGPRALVPGNRVLVLGSGGVSMLALQIARAGGLCGGLPSKQEGEGEEGRGERRPGGHQKAPRRPMVQVRGSPWKLLGSSYASSSRFRTPAKTEMSSVSSQVTAVLTTV